MTILCRFKYSVFARVSGDLPSRTWRGGLWCEIGWLLGLFGKSLSDFPWYRHVIPFLYYVLYTFLLRQLVLDLFGAREDAAKRQRVETAYIVVSLLAYTLFYLRSRAH